MMQDWFRKAKLGVFIHWGLYAVEGVPESWTMASGEMSCEEYYKQAEKFTADKYDPKEWAKYFKAAGANYVVLTTKHHEGFCMFDTEYTDFNVVKATPCGKDLIAPYAEALREQGIKVGLYFTNTDWADDDHMRVILDMTQEELDTMRKNKVAFRELWEGHGPALPEQKEELDACWQRFMTRYKGEIRELMTRIQPDIFWTDVMLCRPGFSWECEDVKKMIETIKPTTIVNGRLGDQGDYETPECYIPLRPLKGEWELCTTMNDSWGYQKQDHNYKDIRKIVKFLVSVIGLLFLGIALFSHDYVSLFFDASYAQAWTYIPMTIAVFAIKTIYYFYVEVLFYYKKASRLLFVATLSSSILNVLLTAFMVPLWGVYGSIVADAISIVVRVVIVVYISKGFEDIGLRFWDFVGSFVETVLFIAVGSSLSYTIFADSFSWWNFAFKVLIVMLYVGKMMFLHKEQIKAGVLMIKRKNRKGKGEQGAGK